MDPAALARQKALEIAAKLNATNPMGSPGGWFFFSTFFSLSIPFNPSKRGEIITNPSIAPLKFPWPELNSAVILLLIFALVCFVFCFALKSDIDR